MSKLRFYFLFASGNAVVLTALSALWLFFRLPYGGIILTLPMLSVWVVGAISYPHLDLEGSPEIVGLVILAGLIFIQWFPVGLVVAYLFRSYRLRRHE